MVEMEYVEVHGARVPKVGIGTWQVDETTAERAVTAALEAGYRHVDTAQLYHNERGVGRALAGSGVDRDDVFLTTKLNPWTASRRSPWDSRYGAIVESVEQSLERLQVEYVDLLLLHWPNPLVDLGETMAAMNELVERGATRFVGVSNFGVDRLKRARELSDAPILTDQVLFHPYHPQRDLLRYCQRNDVVLTGYSPLGNGAFVDDPALEDVGRAYGKTAPQVAIRWATQHENVVTIPQSTNPEHIAANLDVFDFSLSREEIERITRPSRLQTGYAMLRGQLGV